MFIKYINDMKKFSYIDLSDKSRIQNSKYNTIYSVYVHT